MAVWSPTASCPGDALNLLVRRARGASIPLLDKALSAPGGVLLGGLGFWAMAWGVDAWTHVLTFGIAQGAHVHGGDAIVRVAMSITGVPLIALGIAQLMGTEALLKRGGVPLFVAALALMLDGLAHAFAFNDHLGEPPEAAFFALVAPAQIALGAALPFAARGRDRWLVAGAIGLLALYVVSRAAAFAPLGWPERVEGLDLFSKAMEVLFILSMVALYRAAPARRPRLDASARA